MTKLVFIDTNIYLDFYRIESREAGLGILDKIKQHRDIIITGDQIAMEFKKNRQKVIFEVYKNMKGIDWNKLQLPPVLGESKASRAMKKHKDEVTRHSETLKKRFMNVLKIPGSYDPVYKVIQYLAQHKGAYNLSRDKDIRTDIRDLAKKRFMLGYPPRKIGDTSIGDAINWEWVIRCAIDSKAGIVIVTRDNDYGLTIDNKMIINDWLREEFKARVGRKRQLVLTDRLSVAFKATKIEVTKDEEKAEEKLLEPITSDKQESEVDKLYKLYGHNALLKWLKLGPEALKIPT